MDDLPSESELSSFRLMTFVGGLGAGTAGVGAGAGGVTSTSDKAESVRERE